jgi:hypothetical protein
MKVLPEDQMTDGKPSPPSQFPHKITRLEIHKHEKHFKESPKVKVLASIYFSTTG